MINHILETPNGTTLMGAATLPQLEQTSMKTFFEMMPSSFIANHAKQKGYVDLVNGHRVLFRPLDDPGKARSLNLSCFHIEEASEVPLDYFIQLQTRLRNHATTKHIGILSTNPDMGWVKTEFLLKSANIYNATEKYYIPEEDKNPNFATHIAPTHLNTHLPPNFYEDTAKGKPHFWIARYLDGSFSQTEGQVYPMFQHSIVEPFKIPNNWQRVGGSDFGIVDPTVLLLGAIDPETGTMYIYDEYYQNHHAVPHHAKEMNLKLDDIPNGGLKFLVADPSGKRRNMTDHASLFDHYAEYGIYFKDGNNRIESGIMKVYTWLGLGKLKVFSSCRHTIREHLNYKYKPIELDAKKNPDEKPVDKDNHTCFVAGTLIETKEGLRPIETIKIGDYVWTRQGYKRVYDSAKTGVNSEVYEVLFSNGSKLVATGNHPIWVRNKGFLRLDSLRYSDIIEVSEHWEELKWSESNTKESLIEDTLNQKTYQTQDISSVQVREHSQKRKKCISIDKYGLITSGKYLKDSTFTIRTMTQPITVSKTWSWSMRKTIYRITPNSKNPTLNTLNASDHSQKSGMVQKKDVNGTVNTLKTLFLNSLKKLKLKLANTAYQSLKPLMINPSFAPINVNLLGEENRGMTTKYASVQSAKVNLKRTSMEQSNIVQKSVKVLGVNKLETKHDVYNISVEDAHEYFAEGILVSNCDALRYIISELPDDPSALIQKSYNPREFNHAQKQEHLPFALQDTEEEYHSEWLNY